MRPAYNVQLCVIYDLISSYIDTQSRNDLEDFIKILEKHYEMYGSYLDSMCADSGYGSLKNYRFLKEHKIKNFVKYLIWEGNVSSKRPSQYRINKDKGKLLLVYKQNHLKNQVQNDYQIKQIKSKRKVSMKRQNQIISINKKL